MSLKLETPKSILKKKSQFDTEYKECDESSEIKPVKCIRFNLEAVKKDKNIEKASSLIIQKPKGKKNRRHQNNETPKKSRSSSKLKISTQTEFNYENLRKVESSNDDVTTKDEEAYEKDFSFQQPESRFDHIIWDSLKDEEVKTQTHLILHC